MKLISSLLSLSQLVRAAKIHQGRNSWDVPGDGLYSAADDEPLVNRGFDDMGGVGCPNGPSVNDIWNKYNETMMDFRGGERFHLNRGDDDLYLDIDPADGTINFDNTGGQYNRAKVTSYDGVVSFERWMWNKHGAYIKINKNLDAKILEHDFAGGWFMVKETRDRNELRFNYGNKYHAKKFDRAFVPVYGLVLTWIYMADSTEACVDDTGSIFQMVVLMGRKDRKRQKSRFVFNYPKLAFDDSLLGEEGAETRYGFCETSNGETTDATSTSTLQNLVDNWQRQTRIYYDVDSEPEVFWGKTGDAVLGNDNGYINEDGGNHGAVGQGCKSEQQCWCDDIRTDGQVQFHDPNGDLLTAGTVEDHYRFYGHCSTTLDTKNWGDYGKTDGANRGYFCYVKPLSAECSNDGQLKWPFVQSSYPDAHEEQFVKLEKFTCVTDHTDFGAKPFWRRVVSTMEKKLNRNIKAVAAAGRRAAKRGNRSRSWSPKRGKWAKRKAARANRNAGELRMGPQYNIQCGWGCEHPSDWASDSFNMPHASGPMWQGIDFMRGGNWVCEDTDGVEVEEGSKVPYGGLCYIQCDDEEDTISPSSIECKHWDKFYGPAQYHPQELRLWYLAMEDALFECPI